MLYFKNKTGDVFAFETQEAREEFGSADLIPMGEAELEAHLNPPPVPLTLEQVQAKRRAAYAAESDPIKNEADYDAVLNGLEPDYTAWMAAVAAIKDRYPLPGAQ